MLKTRIVTALVLLGAFLSALFYLPTLGWVLFATLVAAVAAWEWGALMALAGASRVALAGGLALICLSLAALDPAALGLDAGFADAGWRLGRWFYVPSAAFWLLAVPFVVETPLAVAQISARGGDRPALDSADLARAGATAASRSARV